jgi:hypothetical protein
MLALTVLGSKIVSLEYTYLKSGNNQLIPDTNHIM